MGGTRETALGPRVLPRGSSRALSAEIGGDTSALPPSAFSRPGAVALIAVLRFIAGLGFLSVAAMGFLPLAILGLVSLAGGIGLWRLKSWGRTLELVLSFSGLFGFPCGLVLVPAVPEFRAEPGVAGGTIVSATIVSGLILYYLFKPGVRILFSERSPRQLTAQERAEVSALGPASTAFGAVLAAAVLIGIVIAVILGGPRRFAPEPTVIGDIRTIISAQAAYQASNAGLHESRLSCLSNPFQNCIPGYPAGSPTFLDSQLASLQPKAGYARSFVADPTPRNLPANASPTSTKAYVYIATPLKPGTRGFGGDSSGVLCFTSDGSAPGVTPEFALDLATCQVLQ